MSYNRKRYLQNRITAGHWTLPVAIFLSAACWLLTVYLLPEMNVNATSGYSLWEQYVGQWLPGWGEHTLSLVIIALTGYLLILLNNVFALIRLRATVQTSLYLLLASVFPTMHLLQAGNVASVCLLLSLFLLFRCYQHPNPSRNLFHSFLCLGVGSLCLPQLMWLIPILWIGAYRFQALNVRSFFASLLGWGFPYWLLLGYAYYYNCMELFYLPFQELVTFYPWEFNLQVWEWGLIAYLLLLCTVSASHCLVAGFEDKLRTRSYLNFLILLTFALFGCMALQPQLCRQWIPLLLPIASILSGHLFALTSNRSSNLFFLFMLIALFLLFGFSLWTLY